MRDVIEMAREAGFTWEPINNIIGPLKRFEQLVRADEREEGQRWFDAVTAQHKQELLAEREACARVCESLPMQQEIDVRDECAAAIRARSKHD
jgi:hypothetical protein